MSLLAFVAIGAVVGGVLAGVLGRSRPPGLVRRVDPADVSVWAPDSSVPDAFRERWERNWAELLSLMREGDELWAFSDFPQSGRRLSGCAGYVIVRDGKPTDHRIVTVIS
jgi:hypothetical protein